MSRRKQKAARRSTTAGGAASAIMQRFQQAQHLHQQGRLNEAEPLYRELLSTHPDAAGPMHFLGLLCMQRGDLEQADVLMASALKLQRDPLFLSNYGMLHARAGRHAKAIELYAEAVERKPDYAEAWFNLGVSRADQGDFAQAIAAYKQAISVRPDYVKALFNLVAALHANGNEAEAAGIVREMQQVGATSGRHGADLALALQRVGGVENIRRAREILTQSLERNPDDLEVGLALARLLDETARHDEALSVYRALIRRQPGSIDLQLGYGECLLRNGMLLEARECINQLPVGTRDEPAARVILGDICRFEGEFAAAITHYESALGRDPACVGALHGLAQSRRYDDQDAGFAQRLSETARNKGSALLRFAAGKVYDDMGRYDEAFAAFAEANRARNRSVTWDSASFSKYVDSIIRTFDALDAGPLSGAGNASPRPLFILGAPRSGTTLVEQMLAAHPAVVRGGELNILGQLARNGAGSEASASAAFPERIATLISTQVSAEAASYLTQTESFSHSGQTRHVTDKMPLNFLHIGYLWLLFPRASVIHCRRHPTDTCLSMFFQSFSASYPFAFDLENLAAWYRDYQRLMNYWDARFPGRIFHVEYRDAVLTPKDTLIRMLTRIGLEWDPACEDFHQAKGPVLSASHWQVRQPVYQRSLDRWRHYQQHIPQLLALGVAA